MKNTEARRYGGIKKSELRMGNRREVLPFFILNHCCPN
jgi:hypothetical protein